MAHINKQIFREYDIRGVSDVDLDTEKMFFLGRAIGSYLVRRGFRKTSVGMDNRTTSPEYRDAVVEGLVESGFDVFDVGLITSPMSYFTVHHLDMPAVMITASHNPKEYNGVKLTLPGESVHGEELQKIYGIFTADDFVRGQGTLTKYDIETPYLAMLQEKINISKPLKVVIDCGNGTTSLFAEKILRAWGVDVVADFCESDGTFPNHIPDPVKVENAMNLGRRVVDVGADLGIGFDGDGDRLGVVDEKGNMIYGDMLMIPYYREVLKKYPGMTCLIEVKCSQVLFDECAKLGGAPEFYRTGHSLIKARMKEVDSKFAGEMSGHMFFGDEYFGYDDCFYAAGRILRILAEKNMPFSEMLADIPKYPSTPEVRVATTDEDKFTIVDELTQEFKKEYEVVDVDGARVQFPNGGWGLIRASNTQPVIVVRAEAKTNEELRTIKDILEKKLRGFKSITEIDWSGTSH